MSTFLDDKSFFFLSVDWNYNWERQHEITYRYAENNPNDEVQVINSLGLINYSFFDVFKKVRNRFRQSKLLVSPNNKFLPNMRFVSPNIIPWHFFKPIDIINTYLLRKQLGLKTKRPRLVWATYVNASSFEIFKSAKIAVLDLAARRQQNPYLSKSAKLLELEAVKVADAVFVDSIETYNDYAGFSSNIFLVPQGADTQRFKDTTLPKHLEKYKNSRTIVGYCGAFHEVIDYDLLYKMIETNPDFDFVFVGNIQSHKAYKLQSLPNVNFLGRVNYDDLPGYYKLFDIGLIPYRLDEASEGIMPTKFFEYIACQIPVLSSALTNLTMHKKEYVRFYQNLEEANRQLRELASLKLSNHLSDMNQFVDENSWQRRFSFMLSKISING